MTVGIGGGLRVPCTADADAMPKRCESARPPSSFSCWCVRADTPTPVVELQETMRPSVRSGQVRPRVNSTRCAGCETRRHSSIRRKLSPRVSAATACSAALQQIGRWRTTQKPQPWMSRSGQCWKTVPRIAT